MVKNKVRKKEKGITIIALVITIIALLILAGVSIAMLTNTNGVLQQANRADIKIEFSAYKESLDLINVENSIADIKELEGKTIQGEELKKYIDNISDEYINKFIIYNSKLIFIDTPTELEKEILDELEIENMTISKIEMIEKEVMNFDMSVPPENGIEDKVWEVGNNALNLGTGVTYNEEKGCIEQASGIGKAPYIVTDPFVLNYDESFTIEYVFKMTNLTTYNSDIELMSIENYNTKVEHILFYTNAIRPEKWFAMYSHPNGLLAGVPHRDEAGAPSPLELYNEPITLTLVYDKENNLIKQYVNGELNRSTSIRGNLTGKQTVTWSNTRQDAAYYQRGISGDVYYLGIYETKVSDEQLKINHLEYLEKYK